MYSLNLESIWAQIGARDLDRLVSGSMRASLVPGWARAPGFIGAILKATEVSLLLGESGSWDYESQPIT